jgi:hypothetical protein
MQHAHEDELQAQREQLANNRQSCTSLEQQLRQWRVKEAELAEASTSLAATNGALSSSNQALSAEVAKLQAELAAINGRASDMARSALKSYQIQRGQAGASDSDEDPNSARSSSGTAGAGSDAPVTGERVCDCVLWVRLCRVASARAAPHCQCVLSTAL